MTLGGRTLTQYTTCSCGMGGEKKGILVLKQSRALLDFARGTAYDANDWYGLQMFHPAGFNITHSCDKVSISYFPRGHMMHGLQGNFDSIE